MRFRCFPYCRELYLLIPGKGDGGNEDRAEEGLGGGEGRGRKGERGMGGKDGEGL